uniref:Pentacotripeptide-repeat region of PRORP domain-containing protein n=1 Tax=Oryza brachyantha TaxID=4533 RepID=J3LE88_ORYBR
MLQKDVKPSTVNYTIVIDKLFKERNYGLATRIWGRMVSLGCNPDVVTYTTSMRAYCIEGRLNEAENVLIEMSKEGLTIDAMACYTLLDGYASIGQTDNAVSNLKQMTGVASVPNQFNYFILLRHLLRRRLAEDVQHLAPVGVWDAIELTDVFGLFDPNSGVYSAILEGFSEGGRAEEVTPLVSRMKEDG